ncbi:uncharacterized protein N7511_002187 [Penicillium nucicola]|uniref:uncharacterized protein n=1 Tax=Penicillium nucicola TaxID=1850975 RepID=UPI00254505D3|nr:uncharacterized protein N7511_002187 [Penicillium nucicola]KAJ5770136.1 hypothetical protein N7511_002187 [Penicillium nucicola]
MADPNPNPVQASAIPKLWSVGSVELKEQAAEENEARPAIPYRAGIGLPVQKHCSSFPQYIPPKQHSQYLADLWHPYQAQQYGAQARVTHHGHPPNNLPPTARNLTCPDSPYQFLRSKELEDPFVDVPAKGVGASSHFHCYPPPVELFNPYVSHPGLGHLDHRAQLELANMKRLSRRKVIESPLANKPRRRRAAKVPEPAAGSFNSRDLGKAPQGKSNARVSPDLRPESALQRRPRKETPLAIPVSSSAMLNATPNPVFANADVSQLDLNSVGTVADLPRVCTPGSTFSPDTEAFLTYSGSPGWSQNLTCSEDWSNASLPTGMRGHGIENFSQSSSSGDTPISQFERWLDGLADDEPGPSQGPSQGTANREILYILTLREIIEVSSIRKYLQHCQDFTPILTKTKVVQPLQLWRAAKKLRQSTDGKGCRVAKNAHERHEEETGEILIEILEESRHDGSPASSFSLAILKKVLAHILQTVLHSKSVFYGSFPSIVGLVNERGISIVSASLPERPNSLFVLCTRHPFPQERKASYFNSRGNGLLPSLDCSHPSQHKYGKTVLDKTIGVVNSLPISMHSAANDSEPPGLTSDSSSNEAGNAKDNVTSSDYMSFLVENDMVVLSLSPTVQLENLFTRLAFDPPPVLFISNAFHRVEDHWLFLRDSDSWYPYPPKLIERNYESPLELFGPGPPVDVPFDADIIAAPNTGIVLSNLEELMAMYPLGYQHRDPCVMGIDGLISPLREKIYRLMPRYEHLYILILKPPQDEPSAPHTSLGIHSNEQVSLRRFCDSFGDFAKATVAIIPTERGSIARWVFGIGRTHINDSGFIHQLDDRLYQMTYGEVGETRAEVLLRTMGLNAYAARMLLSDNRYGFSTPEPIAGIGYDRYNPEHADEWALESLFAMTVEERRRHYAYPIGEKVLGRFEEVLEWSALLGPGNFSADLDPAFRACMDAGEIQDVASHCTSLVGQYDFDSQRMQTDPDMEVTPNESETRRLDMDLEDVSSVSQHGLDFQQKNINPDMSISPSENEMRQLDMDLRDVSSAMSDII